MGVDLIGSGNKIVALIEPQKYSKKRAKELTTEIVKHNKSVKTVIQRAPITRGRYRVKKQKIIWGNKNTEVLHREYGYLLKVDPMKVYFSPRESTVRQHVARQVKSGEKILVMFAGVGPYPICICKTQPKVKEIVAVELNPFGVKYMEENVRINKVSHIVTPIEGDVKKVCRKFGAEFDRIIMPMIKAKDFLRLAARLAKRPGFIHVYMVSVKGRPFDDCKKSLKRIFKKIKYEIKNVQPISAYAPGKWKVLMEIKLK